MRLAYQRFLCNAPYSGCILFAHGSGSNLLAPNSGSTSIANIPIIFWECSFVCDPLPRIMSLWGVDSFSIFSTLCHAKHRRSLRVPSVCHDFSQISVKCPSLCLESLSPSSQSTLPETFSRNSFSFSLQIRLPLSSTTFGALLCCKLSEGDHLPLVMSLTPSTIICVRFHLPLSANSIL